MPALNPQDAAARAVARCRTLAAISDTDTGTSRAYLSPATARAHAQLREWMRAAGLTTRRDHAGNLIGRLAANAPGAGYTTAPIVGVGSHLDTVPDAGAFDGVLGVTLGIEAAAALGDTLRPYHLDVVGFAEEEGVRFGVPYLGSSAVTGSFDPAWLDLVDAAGTTAREALLAFECLPDRIDRAAWPAERVRAFIEPHIEQGTRLHDADRPFGFVAAIAGQSRLTLHLTGAAAHAGTRAMAGRRDAAVAAAHLVLAARDTARDADDPDLRATVGSLRLSPDVRNVVPGGAAATLDVRHPDDATRQRCVDTVLERARAGCDAERVRLDVHRHDAQPAVPMSAALLSRAADAFPDAPALVSQAGHDAAVLAPVMPTLLMFLRDPTGVSHNPAEAPHEASLPHALDAIIRTVHATGSA